LTRFERRRIVHIKMRDSEKPQYDAALKVFREAFARGYADGKRLLLEDDDLTRSEVRLPFAIDVPLTAVLDGDCDEWTSLFEHAGKQAALSVRRTREANLDESESHPAGPVALTHDVCRWHVVEPD